MPLFKRFFGKQSSVDQLVDTVVKALKKGDLDKAASLLEQSDNTNLRAQAVSIRRQMAVLQHGKRYPALGGIMGSPDSLIADYLETEIPYLESFNNR